MGSAANRCNYPSHKHLGPQFLFFCACFGAALWYNTRMKKPNVKLFREDYDQSRTYFAQDWAIGSRNPFLQQSIYWDWFEEKDCKECRALLIEGFGPSHSGSARCQSGSLASGGHRAHCTCDTCF